jgi:hypothetical protein
MADGDLASLISGAWDPTAALQAKILQESQGYQMAQDPSRWQNLGLGGALAHVLAGGQGAMAQRDIGQLAQQRQQAIPDILAANLSTDPIAYAAAHPGMNPIALGRYAGMSPMDAEKLRIYQMGVAPNALLYQQAMDYYRRFAGGAGGGRSAAGRGGPGGAAGGGAAPGASVFPTGTPWRYPTTQAAAAPIPTNPQAAAPQVQRPLRQAQAGPPVGF